MAARRWDRSRAAVGGGRRRLAAAAYVGVLVAASVGLAANPGVAFAASVSDSGTTAWGGGCGDYNHGVGFVYADVQTAGSVTFTMSGSSSSCWNGGGWKLVAACAGNAEASYESDVTGGASATRSHTLSCGVGTAYVYAYSYNGGGSMTWSASIDYPDDPTPTPTPTPTPSPTPSPSPTPTPSPTPSPTPTPSPSPTCPTYAPNCHGAPYSTPPAPTAGPGALSAGVGDFCGTGHIDDPWTDPNGDSGYLCRWAAKAGDEGSGTGQGDLCSGAWLMATCRMGDAANGSDWFVPLSAGQVVEPLGRFEVAPAASGGPIKVQVSAYIDCNIGIAVTASVGVQFFDGSGLSIAGADWPSSGTCNSGGSDHFIPVSPLITVPAETRSAKVFFACITGEICDDNGTGHANALYTIAAAWYRDNDNSAGTLGPCDDATPSTVCGFPVPVDPGTGGQVCGPISHECGVKPFIAPIPFPNCTPPDNWVDVPGWLGYIACLVTYIPTAVYDYAIVPALNVLIDILFPGKSIGAATASLTAAASSRFPFSWFGPVVDGLSAAAGDADAGDDRPDTITVDFMGPATHSVPVGATMDTVASWMGPYRGWLVLLTQLGFVFWIAKTAMSFVDAGEQFKGVQLTFWDPDAR